MLGRKVLDSTSKPPDSPSFSFIFETHSYVIIACIL
jgi:hypothetical protein